MTEATKADLVGKAIVAKLKAAHVGTGLNVKVVQLGDMKFIAFNEWKLDDFLPAILVRPVSESFVKGTQGPNGKWDDLGPWRIVYCAKANIVGGEDVWASKIAAAQKIACTLLDAWLLPAAGLTNGSIKDTRIERVEYVPAEEIYIGEFKGDIFCVAFDYRVDVEGVRNNP